MKFGPPQAEIFGDFGTPKMRFLKGKTLKTGSKKAPESNKNHLVKFRSERKVNKNHLVKFRKFWPIWTLRGGF